VTDRYEVPGVQLIVQDQNMACWYASAMMVLNWAERNKWKDRRSSSQIDNQTLAIYKANNGLQNAQVIPLAKRLGLEAIPPQSPTIDGLFQWLMSFGPLWTNGTRHIVVIAGLRKEDSGYSAKVYDPWPGNGITWRSLSGWYTGFNPGQNAASSRDTGNDVEAVFLHA
jgi:ABC-type bacteriocin/lantibiotic exporter with double-glycine peptidase domain